MFPLHFPLSRMSHASRAPTTVAGGGDPPPSKRRKVPISTETEPETGTGTETQIQPLLPGLPDHVAQLVLSLVPPSLLYSVSRSWRRVIYTPSFPPFLSLYALLLRNGSLSLAAFDPVSATWLPLPPPPADPTRRLIVRHPSFISRHFPVQSVTVSCNLILLAATANNLVPAFPRPVIFSPSKRDWELGPRLNSPRRWCAGGACGGALYAASGVGSHYTTETARSVERLEFDPKSRSSMSWGWEKLGDLESEKMSREAVAAVGWRGKLLVADVAANEGAVYDVRSDTWREMPDGMVGGWRGPAATMDEKTLFAVDDSKGCLRRYDAEGDCWEDVLWAPELKGAEQIAAGGGRVCIVRSGGSGIVAVDVAATPARLWTLDAPDASQVIAVHILPRISRPDS